MTNERAMTLALIAIAKRCVDLSGIEGTAGGEMRRHYLEADAVSRDMLEKEISNET